VTGASQPLAGRQPLVLQQGHFPLHVGPSHRRLPAIPGAGRATAGGRTGAVADRATDDGPRSAHAGEACYPPAAITG
jgi:hypothetical protein